MFGGQGSRGVTTRVTSDSQAGGSRKKDATKPTFHLSEGSDDKDVRACVRAANFDTDWNEWFWDK